MYFQNVSKDEAFPGLNLGCFCFMRELPPFSGVNSAHKVPCVVRHGGGSSPLTNLVGLFIWS